MNIWSDIAKGTALEWIKWRESKSSLSNPVSHLPFNFFLVENVRRGGPTRYLNSRKNRMAYEPSSLTRGDLRKKQPYERHLLCIKKGLTSMGMMIKLLMVILIPSYFDNIVTILMIRCCARLPSRQRKR